MENNCFFVSSRGILKSCSFYSQTPMSSCKTDTKYLINMLQSNNMFNGMSIYVCSDLLKFFVNTILPNITNNFVLVSGDSDLCVPKEVLSKEETFYLLRSPLLLKWFTQNTRIEENEKIIQIPIGLDYHTILRNPNSKWKQSYEGYLPIQQEEILINIVKKSEPFFERIPKIYINFNINSDRFNQRQSALDIIPEELTSINLDFVPRSVTWQNMSKYTFVLSPTGIGLDCHRTWEALVLGCIPIVCVKEFKTLFEDLPVLLVNDWSDITQELLDETIEDFKYRTFNENKLTLSYWTQQINYLVNNNDK
jgi:hypothetical protein